MAAYALPLTPGDRILTGRAEYSSNLYGLLQIARRSGAHIDIIPDDENGTIDCAMLQARLDGSAKLIALTHIPTNNGLVNPAAEVGRIARAAGIPYLLDACQSIGQMPVDVAAIGCDMLAATGRKFLRAPRGTGFLYVRREWIERLEPPLIDNHAAAQGSDGSYVLRGDARRFEAWEHSPAARLGLGAAADYALGWGLDAIRERTFALAATLRSHLADLPGISVLDRGIERCGIVTFASAREGAEALHARLRARGIHCSLTDPAPAALSPAAPSKALRASVHYYNSEAEVAAFVAAVSSAPISA
jgi:selenocysteine lyase/cysteine desulfurase